MQGPGSQRGIGDDVCSSNGFLVNGLLRLGLFYLFIFIYLFGGGIFFFLNVDEIQSRLDFHLK